MAKPNIFLNLSPDAVGRVRKNKERGGGGWGNLVGGSGATNLSTGSRGEKKKKKGEMDMRNKERGGNRKKDRRDERTEERRGRKR